MIAVSRGDNPTPPERTTEHDDVIEPIPFDRPFRARLDNRFARMGLGVLDTSKHFRLDQSVLVVPLNPEAVGRLRARLVAAVGEHAAGIAMVALGIEEVS